MAPPGGESRVQVLHRRATGVLHLQGGADIQFGVSLFCVFIFVYLLLFYVIKTVFQLYHGSDTMSEIRRRKPEPTLFYQFKRSLTSHNI